MVLQDIFRETTYRKVKNLKIKKALPSQATHLRKLNYYDKEFKDMYMENNYRNKLTIMYSVIVVSS